MIKKLVMGLIIFSLHTCNKGMDAQSTFSEEDTAILECFQRALQDPSFRDRGKKEVLNSEIKKKKGKSNSAPIPNNKTLSTLVELHYDLWMKMKEFLNERKPIDTESLSKYYEIKNIIESKSKTNFLQGFFGGVITCIGLYTLYRWIKGR